MEQATSKGNTKYRISNENWQIKSAAALGEKPYYTTPHTLYVLYCNSMHEVNRIHDNLSRHMSWINDQQGVLDRIKRSDTGDSRIRAVSDGRSKHKNENRVEEVHPLNVYRSGLGFYITIPANFLEAQYAEVFIKRNRGDYPAYTGELGQLMSTTTEAASKPIYRRSQGTPANMILPWNGGQGQWIDLATLPSFHKTEVEKRKKEKEKSQEDLLVQK